VKHTKWKLGGGGLNWNFQFHLTQGNPISCFFSAVEVDGNQFLREVGSTLVAQACGGGSRLERAMRCLGGNLLDFLTTLDGVHDVLRQGGAGGGAPGDVGEAGSDEPAFVCARLGNRVALTFNCSRRPVAGKLLPGALSCVADRLYGTPADIRLEEEDPIEGRFK